MYSWSALQEVTPHFVHHLLCEDWVQERYYVSSDALHPSLQPFGQYTLSTVPFERVESYTFGKLGIKRCLFTTVAWNEARDAPWSEQATDTRFLDSERETRLRRRSHSPPSAGALSDIVLPARDTADLPAAPRPPRTISASTTAKRLLTFANLHLSADPHGVTTLEGSRQRRGQLRRIFRIMEEHYADSHDHFLLGDFNFGDDSEENQNLDPTYRDLWKSVHPSTANDTATTANSGDSAGYTCDRFHNRITQLLCPTGKPVRTDRILMRSMYWFPDTCDIILDRPFQVDGKDVFPSDHFGVCASVVTRSGDDDTDGGIHIVHGDDG